MISTTTVVLLPIASIGAFLLWGRGLHQLLTAGAGHPGPRGRKRLPGDRGETGRPGLGRLGARAGTGEAPFEVDERGAMAYGRTAAGGFELVADPYGNTWEMDFPVVLVDWHAANAYAAWLAERTGQPWRLPRELEWEKAARGTDGRRFPWGNTLEETWANMRWTRADAPRLDVVHSFPIDESPYGVRGMAGNSRDWCADAYVKGVPPRIEGVDDAPDAPRVVRGGSWTSRVPRAMDAGYRMQGPPNARDGNLGFRLARSLG